MPEVNTQKQKILFVITQGFWGGAQQYVSDMAAGLCDTFAVTVAVGEPSGKKDLQDKLPHHTPQPALLQLHHLVRHISPWRDIMTVFELRKLYKTLQPDIVHLNSSKAGIAGSIAALFLRNKPKVVYTAHGWVFHESLALWKKHFYTFLEKITSRLKDAVIVLSEKDAMAAKKTLHIPQNRIEKIPIGISPSAGIKNRALARKKLENMTRPHPTKDGQWIGVIANLYKTKGIDVLIDTLHQYPPPDGTQVYIIGDGPERNTIEQHITASNLRDTVHMVGYIEDARTHLSAFDFFVIPSRKEGLPYTLLEAIIAGVPIIATDVGGISEIIVHKKTGLLIPSKDTEALGNAIIYALDNSDNMRKYAASAKQFLTHTKTSMIKQTKALYKKLLVK